jgi:hypothetical protein
MRVEVIDAGVMIEEAQWSDEFRYIVISASSRTPAFNFTYRVSVSCKNQTPIQVWITPLAAADTICVTGEVTLMERKPAMHIKKPNTPYSHEHQ